MSTMVCAVSGVPLWNVMSGRSFIVQTVRSSFGLEALGQVRAVAAVGGVLHQRVVDRPHDVVAAGRAAVLPRTQAGRLGLETHDHRAAASRSRRCSRRSTCRRPFGLRPVSSRRWSRRSPRSRPAPWCRPRSCRRSRTRPPRRRAPMESRVLSVPVAVACIPHLVVIVVAVVDPESITMPGRANVAINTPCRAGDSSRTNASTFLAHMTDVTQSEPHPVAGAPTETARLGHRIVGPRLDQRVMTRHEMVLADPAQLGLLGGAHCRRRTGTGCGTGTPTAG